VRRQIHAQRIALRRTATCHTRRLHGDCSGGDIALRAHVEDDAVRVHAQRAVIEFGVTDAVEDEMPGIKTDERRAHRDGRV